MYDANKKLIVTNKWTFIPYYQSLIYTTSGGINTCNGWSDDGVKLFNKIIKRIHKDRKNHGKEFDQAFTERMLRCKDEGTNKYKNKRKRDMVNAYNDLKGDEESLESDEDSENEEYQV